MTTHSAHPVKGWASTVHAAVAHVMVGKSESIDLLLLALLVEGHVLLEDVPGTGKTTMIRALGRALGLSFRRVQCTPDLLPTDITGLTFYNQQRGAFEFREGPVFANLVLADELNRATPRTQAALLEAMQERQVTLDGTTHALPRPFLVLATQNPIEMEGTYPLPEAQLDRFMLRIALGYPSAEEEEAIVRRFGAADPLASLAQGTMPPLDELRAAVKAVELSDPIRSYAVALVRATRDHPATTLGASPRGSIALTQAAQALAALRGDAFVLPDHIQALAHAVLAHRILLNDDAMVRGFNPLDVITKVLETVPVPVEELA